MEQFHRSVSGEIYPVEMETSTASEDFKKNILGRKRYVDKTHILVPLLRGDHEASFFLRPRRFGKTLTLSMLKYFLEDTGDEALNAENRSLFEGMKIMDAGAFYTGQMTSFPVISLTLQGVRDNESFLEAYSVLKEVIQDEYERHMYLLDSDALTERNKSYFRRVMMGYDERTNKTTSMADYRISLKRLTEFLTKVHGKKAVVLIDEYDVPLEKAWSGGYYDQMIGVISPLLQNVLKTNSANLQLGVVTGCLRIAKESIYTGLNNPRINTVLSAELDDAFGFTEEETKNLLSDSGLPDHYDQVREWYDGYHFGNTTIYNPWSVINYIEDFNVNPNAFPDTYWANTSSNAIIRELAERGSDEIRKKAEGLMHGKPVAFSLRDNIVYSELDYHDDNVFNVMLHAGYLTPVSRSLDTITAVIPNKEVDRIFHRQIRNWFETSIRTFDVGKLYTALNDGDANRVREILSEKFLSCMSYYDTLEAYYHGVLLALLTLNGAYRVDSNRESGKGRFDLQAKERVKLEHAIVIEVKISRTARAMAKDAARGAAQARTKRYAAEVLRDGYKQVRTYGIAFFEKECRVCAGKV